MRAQIAALIRGLDDDRLLEIVGDRVAALVESQLSAPVAAPPAREEPRPAKAEKPKGKRPTAERSEEPREHSVDDVPAKGANVPTCAPWTGTDPFLPWPRSDADGTALGIDLAAPGLTPKTKTIAEDVQRLVLARVKGKAKELLDPDDLVQEVYRRILRRNYRPCAWDARKASLSVYVTRIAGCAIADMMTKAQHQVDHELHGDPERDDDSDVVNADPSDPIEALELVDLAVQDSGLDVEATKASGEPVFIPPGEASKPLWKRALEQREAELGEPVPEEEEQPEAGPDSSPAIRRPPKRVPGAMTTAILARLRSETNEGRGVCAPDLVGLCGATHKQVQNVIVTLRRKGLVEARRTQDNVRMRAYWAITTAPEAEPLDIEIEAFVRSESADGRCVLSGDLAGMIGDVDAVARSIARLVQRGIIENRCAELWARETPEPAPTDPTIEIISTVAPEPPPPVEIAPAEPAPSEEEEPPATIRDVAPPVFDVAPEAPAPAPVVETPRVELTPSQRRRAIAARPSFLASVRS